MPASLRPNLLATLTLATTVSMTGCIFPFTRSSDTKLTELVTEDSQPQAAERVAVAPKQDGEKKMPPFARFLGGMFGSENTPQTEPTPDPVNLEKSEPAQRVAAVPTKTPAPQPSTIQPAQDLVNSASQTTNVNAPTNNMPVVVTPETNRMVDKPDVVSRFTQKATKLAESSHPEVVVQPMATPQPQAQPQPQAKPTPETAPAQQVVQTTPVKPGDEALDAHARTPWGERKLLDKAMANSSTNSTTLEHSLELALETVRRERMGEVPAPKAEDTTPKPEMTAHVDVATESSLPVQTEPMPAPKKVAANPLRTSSTKTDWSGSSLRDRQPQTITNDTLTKYPQTGSKWSPKLEPSQPAPEEVAQQEEPKAEPQVTVNPYTKTVGEAIAATPSPGPQVVDNAASAMKSADQQPTSTDDIHFQSSLLNKLQAANRQAKWDFDTKPQQAEPKSEVVAKTESGMPQIVEKDAAQPELPLVAAGELEQASTEPASPQPKTMVNTTVAQKTPETTNNASVAQTEIKEEPQAIKPFIIAEPTRSVASKRGLIRAAEPQPLVMENQDGNWQKASAASAKQIPKLAPVVRASDYQSPTTPSGGSKTYIVN